MKKIAIVGAGITGLTVAWFLQQKYEVLVFEKAREVGGWMQTRCVDAARFECGPRSLRLVGSGIHIWQLINELGIQDTVIESSPDAKIRYIAKDDKLHPLPYNLISLLTSQFTPTLLKGIFCDLCAGKKEHEETVSQFFSRRFGKSFHDSFVNALCAGIYAQGPEELSMQSCFPSLAEKELRYRSIILGSLRSKKGERRPRMISFNEGVQFLPNCLKDRLKATIHCNTGVREIVEGPTKVSVVCDHKSFEVDHVVSTLSSQALFSILPIPLLKEFSSSSVYTVSLGWKNPTKIKPGFGFLTSDDELLGIVFDSNVFVQHNGPFSLRLSVMLKPHVEKPIEKALYFVKKYLQVCEKPDFSSELRAENAIGRYTLGHAERCRRLNELMQGRRISIIGSSFSGVSVGDCIASAKAFTKKPFYT